MKIKLGKKQKRGAALIGPSGEEFTFACGSYKSIDKNADIMTACRVIAETISMMTIHLMANPSNGDQRIINELSRKIDIEPNRYMTRKTFMEALVMNLFLYGKGNAVVRPVTRDGYLEDLEIIQPDRVTFTDGADRRSYTINIDRVQFIDNAQRNGYTITIDGAPYNPDELLHFTLNPDQLRPWMGKGLQASLKDVADSLKQANATKNGLLKSPKPSVVVKVDALVDEFAGPEGRAKLQREYIDTQEQGQPWILPAEQFSVEQVRPLSISDLAIPQGLELDKRTVASITGVPAFMLGVGSYSAAEWNGFINSRIKTTVLGIQQEMTRKLITSPKMYIRLNSQSLTDWDIQAVANVYLAACDRGVVTGNEVRDKIHLEPREGLDELRILENYIPYDQSGNQKKLTGGES